VWRVRLGVLGRVGGGCIGGGRECNLALQLDFLFVLDAPSAPLTHTNPLPRVKG
jgi:hypothetical protein